MTQLKHFWPIFLKRSSLENCSYKLRQITTYDSFDGGSEGKDLYKGLESNHPIMIKDIQEPTNCCMSGCANCVWIEYAEKLSKILKDTPGDVEKIIMEKVQDPNMRAFLLSELKTSEGTRS